ncbi:acetylglutamate kinase [Saccharobesus litoralis]|uniref:Acetylglutamate kinase n=1 Tax=Saccharobesus litoralis TaxID=2172099 RepID=A0A2S0VQJ1_9ALTE|nr:acetylglutamate kinase [Saccharobesus litoralis]AWB66483.1 acetylglutamate kinase [Saccharobesus litoralis]
MTSAVKTLVIKVGGALLENADCLRAFLKELDQISQSQPVVVVHGGGALVQKLLADLGHKSEKKDGLRITPTEHMPYVVGGLAGTANKQMVAVGIEVGAKPVGVCLADGADIQCQVNDPDLGCVGEVAQGSAGLIQHLLAGGYLPLVSSIGATADGQLLNVNADQAAEAIAKILNGQLVLLSDVDGILDGDKQVIPTMTRDVADQLIAEGVITDGMVVKVNTALTTAKTLQAPIGILNWREPKLISQWLASKDCGTTVVAE